jgi:cytoskeleton protein RodZ
MTNFGASFKKARESRGISLDRIAQDTRISTRFLSAIENEEFHLLPGGIFNRGFVRAFAESVGLDPDQTVAEYDRLVSVREPSEVITSAAAPPAPTRAERHLYPIIAGILAIAIAIFYIVTRDTGGGPREIQSPPAAPAPAPTVPQAAPTTPPQTTAQSSQPAAATPAPTPAPPEPTPAPVPPNNPGLTLNVEVHAETWIKVKSDGTTVLPGEVLEPGMTRKFTAENSIQIDVGNAAGLSLKINDRPLKPLGKSGQVRSLTITPSNLKDLIG